MLWTQIFLVQKVLDFWLGYQQEFHEYPKMVFRLKLFWPEILSISLAPTPTCQPSLDLALIANLGQGYYCICFLTDWVSDLE